MKPFQYSSLVHLYPHWDTNITVCSRDFFGRPDALSTFNGKVFCVTYRKDYAPIVPDNLGADKLTHALLEYSPEILELAQTAQNPRFRTDYSWRISNAKFLTPGEGRALGLLAWIREESARTKELLSWMESVKALNVSDLLTEVKR